MQIAENIDYLLYPLMWRGDKLLKRKGKKFAATPDHVRRLRAGTRAVLYTPMGDLCAHTTRSAQLFAPEYQHHRQVGFGNPRGPPT